jgi:hypothetical protein
MFIQSSGVVPKAAASRCAMLAEIPDLLFNTRERVTRVTRRWAAAADTAMSPRYSRSTRPGCGGLCMAFRTSSMIAGGCHFVSAETPGPSASLVALGATSPLLGMGWNWYRLFTGEGPFGCRSGQVRATLACPHFAFWECFLHWCLNLLAFDFSENSNGEIGRRPQFWDCRLIVYSLFVSLRAEARGRSRRAYAAINGRSSTCATSARRNSFTFSAPLHKQPASSTGFVQRVRDF